jgi:hypothetical protein
VTRNHDPGPDTKPKDQVMNDEIPSSVRDEHEALHDRLRQATQVTGEVGESAKALARLMHPHFMKEDRIAMPPLGLLPRWSAAMRHPR